MKIIEPEVGCWYQDTENFAKFSVVSIDDMDNSIEIQYVDGSIETLDDEYWQQIALSSLETPDYWTDSNGAKISCLEDENSLRPEDWSFLDNYRVGDDG